MLPIDPYLPQIVASRATNLIIAATPGSGKTTRVPSAIAQKTVKKVLCVEPRRLACIAAASRVAEESHTKLGDFVGYHVRLDKNASNATKLLFVTTGMLMQYLCADPFLEDVDCVVMDEFHERTMDADIALGMLRYLQREARPEFRLVVMSATLDIEQIARYLPDSEIFDIEAPIFPLEIQYSSHVCSSRFSDYGDELMRWIDASSRRYLGDILVFMSGVGEIHQAIARATEAFGDRFEYVSCHASLPLSDQKKILKPMEGVRRIIFSTNVAESSITIPSIRIVVDTGFAKFPFFDSVLGLSRLETHRISRASAAQRAGRAARLGLGLCVRLWNDAIQNQLEAQTPPEIERLDLCQAYLQMVSWGLEKPENIPLLSAPAPGRFADARALLVRLGAILESGELTADGKTMARLPMEPRLAKWLIVASSLGCMREAAIVAAFLSEAPYRRSQRDRWSSPDLYEDFLVLQKKIRTPEFAQLRREVEDILEVAREIGGASTRTLDLREAMGRSMLAAYPDRLAKPRPPKEKLSENDPRRNTQPMFACMSGNRGVVIREPQTLKDAKFFIGVDLELVRGVERASSTVVKAFEMNPRWIPWQEGVVARYEADRDRVVVAQSVYFDIFTLRETFLHDPKYDEIYRKTLIEAAQKTPSRVLNFESDAWKRFEARIRFVKSVSSDLDIPTFDEAWGVRQISELARRATSFASMREVDLTRWAERDLDPYVLSQIRKLAPERVVLENGVETEVDYTLTPPVIRVKIQKAFGVHHLPKVGGGRVMVMIHLCAPNGRAAQMTQDIENFWRVTYAEVRKQLRGRYPKHDWPEVPPM